jgi:glycosyltransferase involved in cell wall biosynthesis
MSEDKKTQTDGRELAAYAQTVGEQLLETNRKLTRELESLRVNLSAELERAHVHAKTVGDQLLEANARLGATHADLVASRAVAKAHATTEEWLERKTRRLESDFEAFRQTSQNREHQLAQNIAALHAQLAASQTEVARLQAELVTSNESIAALQSALAGLQAQVDVYERSKSWRLTAPLRAARRLGPARLLESQTIPEPASPPPASPLLTEDSVDPQRELKDRRSRDEDSAEHAVDRLPTHLPRWLYEEPTNDYIPLDRSTPVETRIKLIAFYLPQFHPIPENDAWWGKGFTEWTSVTRAKPQFRGHYQPHLPGELGFYDLRVPEVQRRQIELAKLHGIHGFCYYHYWFHGKKLLQRPLDQFLASPQLDFPFCICWANENWTRRWDGHDDEWLVTQQHSPADDLDFIRSIELALRDPRYIRVGDRPLLLIYRPTLFPDAAATAERWRIYCREVGIGELFLMSTHAFDRHDPRQLGFDAALEFVPNNLPTLPITGEMAERNPDFHGVVLDYRHLVEMTLERQPTDGYPLFRSVMPMWDNEPRRSNQGTVFAHSTPDLYREWLEATCRWTERHVGLDKPFVFVNAWNEWAEGAHLEPDRRHGYAYLSATAQALERFPIRGHRPSIVVVSHDAFFHGAQLVALNLVRTLSNRLGYDVDVVLCGPGPLAADFEAAARVHDFTASKTREDKLSTARRLYDHGARIAICNTSVVGEAVELLKLAGLSVVSLVHELPGLIQAQGLEASIERIARFADRVVFPAEVVRDKFLRLNSVPTEKTTVQPQGLYAPNVNFGRRESARRELRCLLGVGESVQIVLGMGFADHRKGIDLFVDVGIRVAEQLSDVAFVWVGHHEAVAFEQACARVAETGLKSRFHFPGPVKNSDVFFAGADAYLMTSREDPFPNVVLQALDAELPVIAFEDSGGFVELLRRGCGLLVPFGDVGSMARTVLGVLRSPAHVKAMTNTGREILARDFSFVNYARTVVELVGKAGPKVSVILPNYNYAKYLLARIQSIIDQTYPPFEVLFLDDCSTDGSVDIATEMLHASGLSYRILTNESNRGTYRQWISGLRQAKGDLIWIAEADDNCAPTFLERLVSQFRKHEVVLAYCQSRQIDEGGHELAPDYLAWTADISETKWREGYVRPGLDEIRDTLAVKNTIPNVSAVLMRRLDLSGVEDKLATLRNAGDWLLYVYLLEHGSIAFVPDALNSHRRHPSSVTIGGNGLNLMRETLMVQQLVIERHRISADTDRKRENNLQRIYEYLGLGSNGPASYKDHEALRTVDWAATG